jgi:hypothetical protein
MAALFCLSSPTHTDFVIKSTTHGANNPLEFGQICPSEFLEFIISGISYKATSLLNFSAIAIFGLIRVMAILEIQENIG